MSTTKKTAAKKSTPAAKKSAAKKAARSGNPAKKAEGQAAMKSANSIADFKARRKGRPLPLPSGMVVTAKRQSLESFIIGNKSDIPNPLLAIVQETLDKGSQMKPQDVMGEKVDLEMVKEMFEMVNLLCCQAVVEPKLHPMVWTEEDLELELCDPDEVGDEITEDRKDDDTLYVDELDEEDRMFIFQWVIGGTDDIARFREEASTDLASVAEVAGA